MSVKTVRRLAAKILKVGESRVKISPDAIGKAEEALTTDDVRALVSEGAITAGRVKGVPRTRARITHEKKKKGRKSGSGSRRGAKYAKVPRKELWKNKTRLQRRTLKAFSDQGRLEEGVYRKAYRMIKGNAWRSRAAMVAHFEDAKWLKPREAKGKAAAQPEPAQAPAGKE
jgi:large subunit ribosomal protein L19e